MLVTNSLEFWAACRAIETAPVVALDIEATGTDWLRDRVVSVQVAVEGEAFYFPFRHAEGFNLLAAQLWNLCTDYLTPEKIYVGHHLAYDLKMLAREGMQLPHTIRDTMLAAHLMNENEPSFKLKDLAAKYLDPKWAESEKALIDHIVERLKVRPKGAKGHLWRLSAEEVQRYGEDDVLMSRDLLAFYQQHLATWDLTEIFAEVCDFQLALIEMELRGLPLDMAVLDELEATAEPKIAELEARIRDRAQADLGDPDFPANPRSHPQMKRWLGPALNVPDTSKQTLLLADDPRGRLLLDHRVWSKLVGSFVKPYRNFVHEGRIHCNLYITSPGTRETKDVHGTVSDRVSSTNPNMQQVPPMARRAFYAPKGYEMVELDYSQAELRLAAHYYEDRFKDSSLATLLRGGQDLHQTTADAAGISRKQAKVRNFAIQYGAGAQKLAHMYQTKKSEEARYLGTYHKLFPGCRKLQQRCQAEAEHKGYIRLWTGRTRRYNDPRAGSYKASNNLIQGGVAQMVRRAIIACWRKVPQAQQILTVHDSILFLIPEGHRHLIDELRAIMQDQPWCRLPMVVDAKVGPNWGEMEDLPRTTRGIPAAALVGVTDTTIVGPAVP